MTHKWFVFLLVLFCVAGGIMAQDDTTDDTQAQSTVEIFVVLCEDRAVVQFTGVMQPGYDIYYQIFSQPGGAGTELTSLRRVQVNGSYNFSETVTYSGGTIPGNTAGSMYTAIAVEGNPSNTVWSDYVSDLQDGCRDNTSAPAGDTSTPSSSSTTTTTTSSISNGQFSDGTSAILSPFGGVVNPNYIPPEKPLVQLGAREEFILPRQETPGLVFAECEDYDVAEPGIIYDTDNVIVFWSWFARTQDQLLDHIENANYSVTYYQTLPLPNPITTGIRRERGLYWVFYYSVLGNLRPGQYYIEYKVTWDKPIFDGYDEYGPGTDYPELVSGCEFTVLPNLQGVPVSHNPWPYQYLNP
ncbi:MAG: hypothetical protein Kow00117_13600 [Phototrophicales bacterium]